MGSRERDTPDIHTKAEANDEDEDEKEGRRRVLRTRLWVPEPPRLTCQSPIHPVIADSTAKMAADVACPSPAILAQAGGDSVAEKLKLVSASPGTGRYGWKILPKGQDRRQA